MTFDNQVQRNRGWWSGLLVLACCLFIGTTTNAQDFCPPDPISVCGLPGAEVCIPFPIDGADQVIVDEGSWNDGQFCFTPAAFGQHDVNVTVVVGTDTTECVLSVVLNEGVKPTITCPEEPFTISMCGPGLACITAPLTKDAGRVFAQGASVEGGNLCVNVDTSGVYTITLYAVNDCGADSCDVTVNVTVNSEPVIECPVVPDGGIVLERCGAGTVCYPFAITGADQISVPGGGSYSGGQICFIADTSGQYTYTVYAQNLCGVSECTLTFAVTINDVPVITCPVEPVLVSGCAGSFCVSLPVENADSVVVDGATYENGQLCFAAEISGDHAITATAYNECGSTVCALTVNVTIVPAPVITCTESSDTITACSGSQICIDLAISDADSVNGGGATWANGQLCFPAEVSGTYSYTVVATNSCSSDTCIVTRTVEVIAPPVITCPSEQVVTTTCISAEVGTITTYLPIENADSVTILNGSDTTAVWSNDSLSITGNVGGPYTIIVAAYNTCGVDTCEVSWLVNGTNDPVITCPDTSLAFAICQAGQVCVDLPIQYATAVSVEGATWADGSLCANADTAGTYIYTVVASNECGVDTCTVTYTVEFVTGVVLTCPDTTLQMPICGMTTAGCVEFPIENADSVRVVVLEGIEGASAGWHDNLVSLAVTDSGLYQLKLVAYSDCGSDSCNFAIHATFGSIPVIACPLTEETKPVCEYPSLVDISLPIENADKVVVFSDDASGTWADGQLSFEATESKLYSFTVVATSECGSDTCLFSVNVFETPAPIIACPDSDFVIPICEAGEVCVPLVITGYTSVTVKGAATWEDGQLCFTADTAGRYGFQVMAFSDCGNAMCGVGVNVTIGDAPQACFVPEADTVSSPLTVFFSNCSIFTGEVTHSWDFGDGTTSSETSPTHTFDASGCYNVTLTVTSSCGESTVSDSVCVSGGQVIIPTPEWINIYCATPQLDGISLQPGDIITAYDPDGVLCGMDVVRGDGQFGFMPVYRDDIYSLDVDEGAEPGDALTFKVNGVTVFLETTVTWTQNGDSYQVCGFLTGSPQVCRMLHLAEGWNLVSWNVTLISDIEEFIANLTNSGCVDVVLGFDQGAYTYDPQLTEYSTLWTVDYHFGYWFKMNCAADIQVCGDAIDPNDNISVYQGWNLVAYWPEDTLSVEDGFASVIDDVEVALGYNGAGLVYQPDQGGFNTLTELSVLNGYWIRSASDVSLVYPGFNSGGGGTLAARNNGGIAASRNWVSAYGKQLTLDGNALAAGSTIEFVSQQGAVCGSAVYNGHVLKFTPVYGAEGTPETMQYPKDGETVQVMVNGQRSYPDVVWGASGDRVNVSMRFSTSDYTLPSAYKLSQNYPNPFNPTTNISFSLEQTEKVQLVVFNLLGQKIATLANQVFGAGEHTIEWNGRDDAGQPVTSGVYFYRLDTPGYSQTRKMVLTK